LETAAATPPVGPTRHPLPFPKTSLSSPRARSPSLPCPTPKPPPACALAHGEPPLPPPPCPLPSSSLARRNRLPLPGLARGRGAAMAPVPSAARWPRSRPRRSPPRRAHSARRGFSMSSPPRALPARCPGSARSSLGSPGTACPPCSAMARGRGAPSSAPLPAVRCARPRPALTRPPPRARPPRRPARGCPARLTARHGARPSPAWPRWCSRSPGPRRGLGGARGAPTRPVQRAVPPASSPHPRLTAVALGPTSPARPPLPGVSSRPCAARPRPGVASAHATVVPLRSAARAQLGLGVCATHSRRVSAALRVRARVVRAVPWHGSPCPRRARIPP
jgi:hypothetical protein